MKELGVEGAGMIIFVCVCLFFFFWGGGYSKPSFVEIVDGEHEIFQHSTASSREVCFASVGGEGLELRRIFFFFQAQSLESHMSYGVIDICQPCCRSSGRQTLTCDCAAFWGRAVGFAMHFRWRSQEGGVYLLVL